MSSRYGRHRAALGGLAAILLLGAASAPTRDKPSRQPNAAPAAANDDPGSRESLSAYEREGLAVDRSANRLAEAANTISQAQRDYSFWQLVLGAFGVAFTGIAAAAAIWAAIWAREAATQTKRSADADNDALAETRTAATDAREDAKEQAVRFQTQMDKQQELVEFTAKTAYAMERAATANRGVAVAMRESAKATRQLAESAILANATMRKQLRANIQFEQATISPLLIGESSEVLVIFKNGGVTPAYNLTSWLATRSMDTGEVPDQPTPDEIGPLSKSPLGPGETKPMRLTLPATQLNLLDRFNRGETTVFVFGEIAFRDIFDEPRHFRFRLYHDRTRAPGALGTHPDGNDAN